MEENNTNNQNNLQNSGESNLQSKSESNEVPSNETVPNESAQKEQFQYDAEHKVDLAGSLENMDPNMAAALAYLIPPFSGILFFVIEKKNNFVRYHAFQSILFGFVAWGLMSISRSIFIIGPILASLISVASILLWLLLMWKAYNKEEFELPILGKVAREQVAKAK